MKMAINRKCDMSAKQEVLMDEVYINFCACSTNDKRGIEMKII